MYNEFPDSANLAVLLKWYGWSLYDVTTILPKEHSFSWDEIILNETSSYPFSHKHYLLPASKPGENLRDTYASLRIQQIHPMLRLPKVFSKEEQKFNISAKEGFNFRDFNYYYLNEFYFQENKLCISGSIFYSYLYPSRVTIPTPQVLDAFSNYFCLIQIANNELTVKKPAQNYTSIN